MVERPSSGSPRSDKPRSDKPRSDKPRSDKPRSDKPRSEKPRSDNRVRIGRVAIIVRVVMSVVAVGPIKGVMHAMKIRASLEGHGFQRRSFLRT